MYRTLGFLLAFVTLLSCVTETSSNSSDDAIKTLKQIYGAFDGIFDCVDLVCAPIETTYLLFGYTRSLETQMRVLKTLFIDNLERLLKMAGKIPKIGAFFTVLSRMVKFVGASVKKGQQTMDRFNDRTKPYWDKVEKAGDNCFKIGMGVAGFRMAGYLAFQNISEAEEQVKLLPNPSMASLDKVCQNGILPLIQPIFGVVNVVAKFCSRWVDVKDQYTFGIVRKKRDVDNDNTNERDMESYERYREILKRVTEDRYQGETQMAQQDEELMKPERTESGHSDKKQQIEEESLKREYIEGGLSEEEQILAMTLRGIQGAEDALYPIVKSTQSVHDTITKITNVFKPAKGFLEKIDAAMSKKFCLRDYLTGKYHLMAAKAFYNLGQKAANAIANAATTVVRSKPVQAVVRTVRSAVRSVGRFVRRVRLGGWKRRKRNVNKEVIDAFASYSHDDLERIKRLLEEAKAKRDLEKENVVEIEEPTTENIDKKTAHEDPNNVDEIERYVEALKREVMENLVLTEEDFTKAFKKMSRDELDIVKRILEGEQESGLNPEKRLLKIAIPDLCFSVKDILDGISGFLDILMAPVNLLLDKIIEHIPGVDLISMPSLDFLNIVDASKFWPDNLNMNMPLGFDMDVMKRLKYINTRCIYDIGENARRGSVAVPSTCSSYVRG
ncbi:unnamed protein product [Owenia fusiformis]|nr:unnamed protein product [Owenia fusiformis]